MALSFPGATVFSLYDVYCHLFKKTIILIKSLFTLLEDQLMVILMADDDADDRLMIKEALKETNFNSDLKFVEDGEELLDYLNKRKRYHDLVRAPLPSLILIDLNMPRKNGNEAIMEIKNDPVLKRIPIVVLTTSRAEEDILLTYNLGANSFISKPLKFSEMVELMRTLQEYWFHTVTLPPDIQSA